MAVSGMDLSPSLDALRPVRSASPAMLAYLEHRKQRVRILIARYVEEADRAELVAMLGLDEPVVTVDDAYPRCRYAGCARPYLPRVPHQRYCHSLCALRARTRPPQERRLEPVPTGRCPECRAQVPLTPLGRIGRHATNRAGGQCRGFTRHPELELAIDPRDEQPLPPTEGAHPWP